jgi:hypothetical protein
MTLARCLFDMSPLAAQDESRAMNRRLTRGSRLLASVMAVALALVSTATCLAAVVHMPEQSQHACCHGMNQDCGTGDAMAAQKDCCAVPNADVARVSTTDQVVAPPALALSLPFVFVPSAVPDAPGAALDPGIPKPSSSPTYLLVSVFRL